MLYPNKFFRISVYSLFILFVFGTFIYNYSQPNFNFYAVLFDENLDIEQTLQRIPTCTLNDRHRHRALLHILQAWTHFTQQHHIHYWITYSTLLGYVQRRGLLPYDLNIHVFVMAQDTLHLLHLSQLNLSSSYQLRVHPQWYVVEQSKRSSFSSEDIDFVGPNARFVNTKEGKEQNDLHLNIWLIYDYHPNETRIEKNSTATLTMYDKSYKWKSTPREWTFPLEECRFSGIKVRCPSEPKKLVMSIYGEVSLNISSKICINGSWMISNEYRSTTKMTKMMNENMSTQQPLHINTTQMLLNDYNLVDKALRHIPTCTPHDRHRQRLLLTTLHAWTRLAEQYNLQYWLAYGSLIGYVQRRGLLPHDPDIDIVMMSNDTQHLVNISHTNFSSQYQIRVQPQWKIVSYENRSYFRSQGIHFVAPNARFIDLKIYNHVDIFPAYDFNPLYSNTSIEGNHSTMLTQYNTQYRWISYPRNWTYPLQRCYFSEIRVLCPAQPEKIVAAMFGVKALTQSDTRCVNGSWVSAR